jgi:hypothetical protein
MRYFFNATYDGDALEDDDETPLSGPEAAMLQAAVVAAELAQDGRSYDGYVIRVTDEQSWQAGTVPVVIGS